LSSVIWTGGSAGNWFDAANWAGGAVPDLANVANVIIPTGVTVNFSGTSTGLTQSGAVHIDSLNASGGLTMTDGELDVGPGGIALGRFRQIGGMLNTQGPANLQGFEQTAGDFLVAGDFVATQQFNQSGAGHLVVNGTTTISSSDAAIVFGNVDGTGAVTVTSTAGVITQSDGSAVKIHGPGIFNASNLGQPAAVNLSGSGNDFSGPVSIHGSEVTIADHNALSLGLVNATGTVTLKSNGALNLGRISTSGSLFATSGDGGITQTGPLSVAGPTTLNSGFGSVVLADPQNAFGGVVIASGSGVMVRNPIADAIAQRYARLEAGEFSAVTSMLTAKHLTIDDISRVFSDDKKDVLNVADLSGGVSLGRAIHF